MKRLLFRLTAVLLAIGLGLLVSEGTLRLAAHGPAAPATPAPPLGTSSHTNSLGFRDVEHTVKKPPGVFRIAVLGDSFTWGHGVRASETYPARLETTLASLRPDLRFEVMNCGIRGFDTLDEACLLEHSVLEFSPDLVILGYCLNDAEPDDPYARNLVLRPLERREPRMAAGRAMYAHSVLCHFVFDRIENTRQRRAFVRYYNDLFRDDFAGWKASRRSLNRIKTLLGKHRTRFLVVVFPVFDSPLDNAYAYRALHEKVTGACRARDIRCLDLLDSYRGIDGRSLAVIPYTDAHPSPLAHRVAANAIGRFLVENGFLPSTHSEQNAAPPPLVAKAHPAPRAASSGAAPATGEDSRGKQPRSEGGGALPPTAGGGKT